MQYQDNLLGIFQFLADCFSQLLVLLNSVYLYGNVSWLGLLTGISVFGIFLTFVRVVILNAPMSAGSYSVMGTLREKTKEARFQSRWEKNDAKQRARDKDIQAGIKLRSGVNDQNHHHQTSTIINSINDKKGD